MFSRQRAALLLSVGLHILVFAWVWTVRPDPPTENIPPPATIQWVEFKAPGKISEKKSPAKSKRGGNKKHNLGKGKNLKQFYLPNYFAEKTREFVSGGNSKYEGQSAGDADDAFDTMNSMSLGETLGNDNFLQGIAARLHLQTDFPDIIARHWHEGKFLFEIVVDHRGVVHTIRSHHGSSAELKTYALLCIYQALSEPLPPSIWYQDRKFLSLTVSMEFKISTVPKAAHGSDHVSYFKNNFKVFRIREVESKLHYHMRQVRKKVPLYITPGGVFVDFVEIYNMVKDWNKLPEGVQRREGLTITREQINRAVENKQKGFAN